MRQCHASYNGFNKTLPIQINKRMQGHSFTTVIGHSLLRVISSRTDMSKCMLLNHPPVRVVEATGGLDELASFLAPRIIDKTQAATVASTCSHSLPVNFERIVTRLEKCQCTLNLVRSELVLKI
jgi:hypothetical protein